VQGLFHGRITQAKPLLHKMDAKVVCFMKI
jgi:hypothetical protein